MKKCPRCGNDILDKSILCLFCGHNLENSQNSSPGEKSSLRSELDPLTDSDSSRPAASPSRQSRLTSFRKVLVISILLGVLLIGVPVAIFLSFSDLPPLFIRQAAREIVSVIQPGSDNIDTSPFPTAFPTAAVDLQLSTDLDELEETDLKNRFTVAQMDIKKATQLWEQEEYAESVLLWNQILDILPEYSMGYFSRASCYYWMAHKNQRSYDEALIYYDSARADLDKAIELGPDGGHLHNLSNMINESQANMHDLMIYRDFWYEKALADKVRAHEMSWREAWGNRALGFSLTNLGRCEEARDYFHRLQEATYPELLPSAGIHTGLADSYLCLEDYDRALEHINRAIEIKPSKDRTLCRAQILLNKGDLEGALFDLNTLLEESPHYLGRRYYLRAVVHYEMGNEDQARADLITGQGNTWDQAGEKAYLLGRMALDQGEIEQGIEYLQLAEATLFYFLVPRLYQETVGELSQLGASTLYPTPTPSLYPTPTPFEAIPDQLYITPTPPYQEQPYYQMNYAGSGLRFFSEGMVTMYSFRPEKNLDVNDIAALYVDIQADYPIGDFPLKMDCVARNGSWGTPSTPMVFTQMEIGENEVEDPGRCVPGDGYIYIAFWNDNNEPLVVENISLRLVVIQEDGSEVVYGNR